MRLVLLKTFYAGLQCTAKHRCVPIRIPSPAVARQQTAHLLFVVVDAHLAADHLVSPPQREAAHIVEAGAIAGQYGALYGKPDQIVRRKTEADIS